MSAKRGTRYEDVVRRELRHFYGSLAQFEVPANGGYIDVVIQAPFPILIEIKSTYVADAYWQLDQYSRAYRNPTVRVCVCACNDLEIRTPEQPRFHRGLDNLATLEPGYYVIPWTGKFAKHLRA